MTRASIRLDNVTIAYNKLVAVRSVSGSFDAGSLTAIAGPNGAGKSTLLKALMGDIRPQAGGIALDNLLPTDLAYLPQAAAIERSFPLSVFDAVMMGAWREVGAFRAISRAVVDRARVALDVVGLRGLEQRQIGALSAGQFQRVLFARLLVQDAKIIVLDEPFSAIDAATTRDLLDLVKRWNEEGRTVIAVLHDLDQVRTHFPRTLLLARDMIDWGPTDRVISPKNLMRARSMSEGFEAPTNREHFGS